MIPESSRRQIRTPTAEEARALAMARFTSEVRDLAKEIVRQAKPGGTPLTLVKGIISAVDHSATPPTVTINIGGDTTTSVSSVRIFENFSPRVGDTVHVAKQGAQIVVLGHVADKPANAENGSWIQASLSNGSHNGGSQGDVHYRKVMDHGSWKMQWRGGWTPSGSTTMISSSGLSAEYRPSGTRSLLAARDANTAIDCVVNFNSDGGVTLSGSTTPTAAASTAGDVAFLSASTDVVSSHSHSMSHDHYFTGGSHSHARTAPSWVSLNGLEYFL